MIGISCIIEENGLFKNINEGNAKELFSAEAKDIYPLINLILKITLLLILLTI